MILNKTSYAHVTIRKLCSQLELLTQTKLITDLDFEFNDLKFIDKYGYIIIDYQNEAIITLNNKLDPVEFRIIEDIILHCSWLEIGNKYAKNVCNKNVTLIFKKKFDNRKTNIYTQYCKEDKKSSKKTISKKLHKM